MPLLTTDPPYRGIIHYERYGNGRPVLFLHGWLGSWQLWRNTIEKVGERYKTYSLDFFGFGESRGAGTKDQALQDYTVDNFVEMVGQFMDKLGIPKAALVGHSMGGTVAMSAALKYPDKVVKACAVGSPIDGESLYLLLKLGGIPQIAQLGFLVPPGLRLVIGTYLLFCANDGRAVRDMVLKDLDNTNTKSFFQSIGTLRRTNLTSVLPSIQQPLLGIYGRKDIIVSPKQHDLMQRLVPHAGLHYYRGSGHFPMLDEPDRFVADILEFLDNR